MQRASQTGFKPILAAQDPNDISTALSPEEDWLSHRPDNRPEQSWAPHWLSSETSPTSSTKSTSTWELMKKKNQSSAGCRDGRMSQEIWQNQITSGLQKMLWAQGCMSSAPSFPLS